MDELTIANLKSTDLPAADLIYRRAFGTQFQLPDPMDFAGDASVLAARFGANPGGAWGAWQAGALVGSCFGSPWGSLGVIGPLTVMPERWGQGIAQKLMPATIAWLERQGAQHLCLSTIPTSPGHLMLYRKFGFHPRFLYTILLKNVSIPVAPLAFNRYANLTSADREAALDVCRQLCNALLNGLDLQSEIDSVFRQKIGDTVFLEGPGGVDGFGICHFGPGSEAESGLCYLKIGAVRSGSGARDRFRRLLDAAHSLAAQSALKTVRAGVSYGRIEAVEAMLAHGFYIEKTGVAMHRYNHEGYNRPGVYMVDDWR